ncbi:hypothetical protein ABT040_35195 [Streptomyces sp. NPDC002688]|uniref:hypothetical protein n=1 Tax=Streptomyces sp. NPDC002688 TaxID=3154423 RepID=UPI00331DD1B7
MRAYERAGTVQVDRLRVQPTRAEDFTSTLRSRVEHTAPSRRSSVGVGRVPPRSSARTTHRVDAFRERSRVGRAAVRTNRR